MNFNVLAHLGERYPYEGNDCQFWWYEPQNREILKAKDVCEQYNLPDPHGIAAVADSLGLIPVFEVDIPRLEREYAEKYFDEEDRIVLRAMEDQYMVEREFLTLVEDKYDDIAPVSWWDYEMAVLAPAAKNWAKEHNIDIAAVKDYHDPCIKKLLGESNPWIFSAEKITINRLPTKRKG